MYAVRPFELLAIGPESRRTRKFRIRGSENSVLSTEWVENEHLAGHMCGLPIAEGLSRMEAGV
jgi:hypothetical protein